MKIVPFFLFFCFANSLSFSSDLTDNNKLPDSLNIIVGEMAHSGVYERGLVGIAGMPSQQDNRLDKIKQLASDSQLFVLIKNSSPIVRLYSFIALLDRHASIPSETVKRLLNDQSIIVSLNGCLATERSMGSIAREIMAQRHVDNI